MVVCIVVSVASFGQKSSTDPKTSIENVLRTQQEAWNRHDLDAFMQGYWNSPELSFFSGAQESKGFEAALDR
jgi:beta-aspartyl-peptidase (threonine type)